MRCSRFDATPDAGDDLAYDLRVRQVPRRTPARCHTMASVVASQHDRRRPTCARYFASFVKMLEDDRDGQQVRTFHRYSSAGIFAIHQKTSTFAILDSATL